MKPWNRRAGFTLIEQLIVIAIIVIVCEGVYLVYMTAHRVERSAVRQQEATRDLTLLAKTWREDSNRATRTVESAGDLRESTGTMILEIPDPVTSQTVQIAYVSRATGDGRFDVERVRLQTSGIAMQRQMLASGLDKASFDRVEKPPMTRMTVSARRGFGSLNSTQEFTAIASLGGAQ